MLVVAPTVTPPLNGHAAPTNWNAFLYMDGPAYAAIAAGGYAHAPPLLTAFFPLYPLISGAIMRITALPFAMVGTLVSNVSFLLALLTIYAWVRERQGTATARWTILTMCCLPLSIYGSLAYTEGLFALLTTLALRDFERECYVRAGIWGALASATRPTGAALIPAFAFGAASVRKPSAWVSMVISCAGIGAYAFVCWRALGDPLAFVHAQYGFRGDVFTRFWPWQDLFNVLLGITGPRLWPYQLGIVACAILWYRKRSTIPHSAQILAGAALTLAELRLWWAGSTDLLIIFAGVAALLYFRARLDNVPTAFALIAVAMIVGAGYPLAADRLAYSLVPLIVALALVWSQLPLAGAVTLAVFAAQIPHDAIRIAQHVWWLTNL